MSKVDLSALRMQPTAAPRRPLAPRLWTVAFVLLAALVALSFLWPLLRPARAVPMAAVRAGEVVTTAGTTAAEAVGWVEADPYATYVRPLVMGRIERLHVLEGTAVVAGETLLAELASAELQAAHDRAAAELALRRAAVEVARSELAKAEAALAQNAMPRQAVLEAEVMLRDSDAALAKLRGMVPRSMAMLAEAEAMARAQQRLRDAGSANEVALQRAEAAVRAAAAERDGATAELAAMERQNAAAAARLALARELAATPVELQFAVRTATQELAKAEAELAAAATGLAIAARELGWTRVVAPVDGIVMRLLGAPGWPAGPDAEPILAIYDPARLRARIDVPFGSVAAVRDGQTVELRSEALGSLVVRGVVQRVQHESDLLKNTLQVKVGIVDPPSLLRPETLVRARFLASGGGEASGPSSFRVPRAALAGDRVFVFDPAARVVRAVVVQVLGEQDGDVLVTGELSVAQRVVLATVQDGEHVVEQRP
jgi:multidrug efflux pump subunit AcrA (membrane-fusion protein)